VVDVCAAPGGKTAQLLSAGFKRVTAIESNIRRSKKLRENLDRLKLHDACDVIVADGQSWLPQNNNIISGILVDVPCSSTGTGARHGSVLRKTNDLEELIGVQQRLANHCADILSPNGILVYSTCSLLKQESEDQIEKLLMRGDLETVPFLKDEITGFDDAIDSRGWIRVLPGVLGGDLSKSDGFFVARLRKKIVSVAT
jgi:16S rRNA (cytosine967-C5)-methyltransferase